MGTCYHFLTINHCSKLKMPISRLIGALIYYLGAPLSINVIILLRSDIPAKFMSYFKFGQSIRKNIAINLPKKCSKGYDIDWIKVVGF